MLERRRGSPCRDRSAALLTVAHAVVTRYAKEKERRGLLDYDDLIDKALKLLANVDAAWVHYKLDLGIDHVLVDEAQDTSHKQWEIVRRLTAEFTAGAGARGLKRTIFAVGDEKQSIYSFQDAAPKEFAEMQRHFKRAHEKSGQNFVVSKFEHSFRSGATILAAVDEVFKRQRHRAERHVGSGRLSAAHRAARYAAGHGRNLGAGETGRAQGDRRLGRAVRYRQRNQPAREAGTAHRAQMCGRMVDEGTRALRRCSDPGAPARRIVRGDHPRARRARTCRSPAPTGSCSPNTSR